ncbi:MAG TPA: cellulase family glycosylhydrolase [Polyangia bacterium]|nr:cellulase family glycosylhydrolase [Polyangia bacterium]
MSRSRPPSGTTTRVFGFLAGDRWTFRFAPAELGAYRFTVRGRDGAIARAGQFQSVAGTDRGPVRIDPRDPHRLRFQDGTPFFILGENRINIYDPSWNYGHLKAADYVAAMAQNGMTTLRLFIVAACKPKQPPARVRLGCLEPRMGQFDDGVARDLDGIFDAAETHGIYVVLTAFAIGFSPGDSWKDWKDNLYNAVNGGTAATNREVFTRDDLREAAKRKLRYLSARYGYSSHLLAIDLLNEPEWDGQIAERDWIPWAEDLARDWKARDRVGHLITVGSIGLSSNVAGDERPLYAAPEIDLVQWHLYGVHDPRANAEEMLRRVRETWGAAKPIFCGEFAYGGEDPALYDHTHDGIWAAVFSGAGALAHSAPPFHLDSDEPMTPARGRHFRVLADFLRALGPDAGLEPDPTAAAAPDSARVLALGHGDARAVWLLGPAIGYGQPVAGATVTLSGVPAGRYTIAWRDDVTGRPIAAETAVSVDDRLVLHAPTFTRHVAARVQRAP